MKTAIVILACVVILINVANAMVILNAPRDLDLLRIVSRSPPRAARVRRSAIAYSGCPKGFKRIPQIHWCVPCQPHDIRDGLCTGIS